MMKGRATQLEACAHSFIAESPQIHRRTIHIEIDDYHLRRNFL